jgi:starch-binding outer membrane protein, SusD/RagB family
MKKLVYLISGQFKMYFVFCLFTIAVVFQSCNEKEFLKEVPLDFYSPENSFVNYGNFESAVLNLYSVVREKFYRTANARSFPSLGWTGTEITYTHKDLGLIPNWGALLLPTNSSIVYESAWKPAYQIIYDTNVIMERVDSEFSELTDDEKVRIKAEASFFRGFAYRILANLYGGVPIVTEEVKTPKRDYVRASRQEVYEQCAADLKFAAENLPDIGAVDDSRVHKIVAFHLLSEIYICLGKWQEAIDAASTVINHPATGLMTQRFGKRINDPGDVYWDLFRNGNQNRSDGNKEALWVLQYEFMVPGGADGFNLERIVVPRLWQAKITNKNGKVFPLNPYPNSYYHGRGSGFIRPSYYFYETVWHKSGYTQDIRNSQYNIVRDFIVNNPASDYVGKWVIKDKVPVSLKTADDTTRNFFPVIAKASDPGKHPKELWHPDQTVPGSLTNNAQESYMDQYVFRLAETYLLRAEAYLGKNDKINAAADINTVRRRAQAPEIDASLVDLDYILDERIRELYFEELRLLTLMRLGKVVERAKMHNPWVGNTYSSHHNLWPIPYDDIEKNIEAVLEQNPGYN